jgi:HD-GYP domain-containing protein (c-di-GMP phosphodiesterase class II)
LTTHPQGVAGEEIPLLSRILAIADAYDAMTQDRVYRKALTHQQAINEIIDKSGKQFDPNISVLFVNLLAEGN